MRRLSSITPLLFLALAAACGSGSPTSPNAAQNAAIAGAVSSLSVNVASVRVGLVGTARSATLDSTGHFTLDGVPPGMAQLSFSGGGTSTQVTIQDVQPSEQIVLGLSLTPTEATIESQRRSVAGGEELEGRVEALPPQTAPNTLVVAGRTVTTDVSTKIFDGNGTKSFTDLLIGLRVHVKGLPQSGGLLAVTIEIQNTNVDIPVELNGVISLFSPPQSAFQFTVNGRLVKGDALTEFFGGSVFADLANGVRVEVKGTEKNGFVYANRIHVNVDTTGDGNQDTSASIEGTLTSKANAIPNLTLLVGGTTVKTTSSTVVRRRGDVQDLAVLQIGMTLHVEGDRQPDTSIIARMLQIKDDDVGAIVEISGSLGGLQGTCPAVHFNVNGYSVVADAGTTFSSPCSTLKSGNKITVTGTKQADGSIKATAIVKN